MGFLQNFVRSALALTKRFRHWKRLTQPSVRREAVCQEQQPPKGDVLA